MATFTGTAGANTFIGSAGVPDLFQFQAVHLTSADTLVGGSGAVVDTLRLTTAGTVAAASLANVSGIEQVQLANGTNALVVTNGLASSANGAVLTIVGAMGNDFVQAGGLTASAIDFSGSGGVDTVIGGLGADTFRFTATALTAADRVTGGGGTAIDQLVFTSAGTQVLTGVTGIEKIVLVNGANTLALSDAFVGAASGDVVSIATNMGNDVINAGSLTGVNRIDVAGSGGVDTVTGGLGADTFRYTSTALTAADRVTGGGGAAVDQLIFTTAGTQVLTGVSGVEKVVLANGTNSMTLSDAVVGSATGDVVTIATNMGNDVINAGGLTGVNRIDVTGSGGNDTVTGGLGTDIFRYTATALTAADKLTGGGGTAVDQLIFSSAGTLVVSGVTGVEKVVLANGANVMVLTDATVGSASNAVLSVVGAGGNDAINGAALTGVNRLDVTSGLGADTLTGGAGADLFRFQGGGLTATDTVVGGAGVDQMVFTGTGSIGSGLFANVSGIDQITLANGANNLILSNAQVGASDADTLTIRGGSGNDVVNGGAVLAANTLDITGMAGNDTLIGGAGADLFRVTTTSLTSADTITGGAGMDRLFFQNVGTVSSAMLSNVRGVDQILLSNGSNNLTLNNAMVGAADNDLVSVSGGTGNDIVNGAGLTAPNRLDVSANVGADTLTGGAGADTFRFAAAALAATDTVNGNTGLDTLAFTTTGTIGSAALANVSGVEIITLANGVSRLTLSNAMVGAADNDVVTVVGSDGSEVIDASLVSSANSVTILGGSGADTLTGGAGDDLLSGDAFDTLNGGGGNDRILTGSTAQFANLSTFLGGSGNDAIEYNFANNNNPDTVIDGGADSDTLFDVANDSLVIDLGIVGADQTTGDTADIRNFENVDWSQSASVLLATGADSGDINTILGGAGNDTINGNGGADVINGNGGDDTLLNDSPDKFATGATFLGGSGNDRIEYNVAPDADGIPLLDGGTDSDTLVDLFVDNLFIDLSITGADQSAADLIGTDDFSDVRNFENVDWSASSGNLTAFGSGAANTLLGGTGTDTLLGFGGADRLVGVAGGGALLNGDTLDGGNGDDFIQYNNAAGQSATLDGGGGIDTLYAEAGNTTNLVIDLSVGLGQDQTSGDNVSVRNFVSVNWFFSAGKLVATLGDGLDGSLIGGVANNTLTGGSGNNTIGGGGGFNTLTGGGGNDTFRFDTRDTDADRIVDFSNVDGNDDTFQFVTGFGFNTNTNSTDFVITTESPGAFVDITQADLVIFTAGFNTTTSIANYLNGSGTSQPGQGMFFVGRVGGVGSDVHLFHVQDAGNPAGNVFDIANLGASFDPATLVASDFVFT
ncbi:beta strand repeat-containing protein [Zavarzinia sp. CC-PAN008]|uniref:beta strand repeat-containing protein n=1 Tax=Zavarzinia sp. CC-PAN008 TaxID=3243332 RepID=UPI003F74A38B